MNEARSRSKMENGMGILGFLLVGFAATLGTMVIHGLVVHTIIMEMRRDLQRGWLGARLGEFDICNRHNFARARRAYPGGRAMVVRVRSMWWGRRFQRGLVLFGW